MSSDAAAAIGIESSRAQPTGDSLRLLGRFELVADGKRSRPPMSAQRVAAFIALHDHPLQRAFVAGSLWPDTPEVRAHANLRSALWRLGRHGSTLIDTRGQALCIRRGVSIDVREVEAAIRVASAGDDSGLSPARLADDLLPNWYDDWVLLERERFRQLRLHALELLCDQLTQAGRLAEALEAGLAAVAGEPLRESAHRALVRVHLAEGNGVEALRQYGLFKRMLREQLGVEPSPQIEQLVVGVRA